MGGHHRNAVIMGGGGIIGAYGVQRSIDGGGHRGLHGQYKGCTDGLIEGVKVCDTGYRGVQRNTEGLQGEYRRPQGGSEVQDGCGAVQESRMESIKG